ncbi:MAG: carbohydrate ABC transporter permease [Saccharofermentanales bacterium]
MSLQAANKRRLKNEISKNMDKYLMMLPFSIFFFLFTIISVISAIVLSFTNYNMIQPPEFIGWLNYVRMFLDDEVFPIVIRNTLIFALITGPISYIGCLFIAWLINELPPRLRAFVTLVFYIPSISSTVFAVWGYIFSGDSSGLVNSTLIRMGILYEPIQWLSDPRYSLTIIIIVQLWASLGTSFLAFIAGLQGIDRALFEAGQIDGIKNRFQELRFITLPSMGPQLLFAAVMQIGASFAVSQVSIQLAGFPSTDYAAATIVTHLLDHGTIRFEMGYASAIATILFISMVTIHWIIKKMLNKYTAL